MSKRSIASLLLVMQVDVYDGTADFLRKLELDEDALTKAIIGTIGDIDSYQLPDAKGYTAFLRHVLGVTDEERQQRREQILGTTVKDFRCSSLRRHVALGCGTTAEPETSSS